MLTMNSYTMYKLENNMGKLKKAINSYDSKATGFQKEMDLHKIVAACKAMLESADYKVTEQIVDADIKTKKQLLKYFYNCIQSITSEPLVISTVRDNKVLTNLIEDIGGLFYIDDEMAIISKIKSIINKIILMFRRGDCPFEINQLVAFNRTFCRNKEKDGVNFIINSIILELIQEQEAAHQCQLDIDSDKLEKEFFAKNNGGMFSIDELDSLITD